MWMWHRPQTASQQRCRPYSTHKTRRIALHLQHWDSAGSTTSSHPNAPPAVAGRCPRPRRRPYATRTTPQETLQKAEALGGVKDPPQSTNPTRQPPRRSPSTAPVPLRLNQRGAPDADHQPQRAHSRRRETKPPRSNLATTSRLLASEPTAPPRTESTRGAWPPLQSEGGDAVPPVSIEGAAARANGPACPTPSERFARADRIRNRGLTRATRTCQLVGLPRLG